MATHRRHTTHSYPRATWFAAPIAVTMLAGLVAMGMPAVRAEEPSAPTPSATSPAAAEAPPEPEQSVGSEPTQAPAPSGSPKSSEASKASEASEAAHAHSTDAVTPSPAGPDPQATPDQARTKSSPAKSAAAAAQATGAETLTLTLKQQTGTGPFDDNDDPGNDSSADNDIVRTNDTITYTVGVRYEGGDQTKPTIRFTLPRGQELVSMPPFCLTGSSVTPASLPAPVIPVTATSWQTLPIQSVTCVVHDQTIGTSLDYKFVSKVRSEVPNATTMTPIAATATSDQVTTAATSPSVSQSVSAAANFDVSKRGTASTNNTGPLYGQWGSCSFDTTRTCRLIDYPLTINTPNGGKGVTSLASPFSVTDDLSPNTFFGPGTTTSAPWLAAGAGALSKYGARLTYCDAGPLNVYTAIPNSKATSATVNTTNSVRNSGTITCAQSGPGAPVDITFTNADTTAYTVPTTSSYGSALAANTGYVVATSVRVEVPIDAFYDLGTEVGGVHSMETTNTFTNFNPTDISGAANTGEKLENNTRTATATLGATGAFGKGFSAPIGEPGNTPTGQFSGWEWEGPPGSGSYRDGNTVVVPGQTVLSNLLLTRQMPPGTGSAFGASSLMCDTWNETKLRMPVVFTSAARTYTRIQLPSNGSPAWISSWNNAGFQTSSAGIPGLSIEYGYTQDPENGDKSTCASGVWASTPDGVPGATQVDGLWAGINRVRVFFRSVAPPTGGAFDVNASIALRVLDNGDPIGTVIPNWASLQSLSGDHTQAEVIATGAQSKSTYVPATHAGGLGDRLTLGAVTARIKKYVENPVTGAFTDTAVPQYTAGSDIDYRLNPSLTADVNAGVKAPVIVEDCLPAYQAFVSSRRASGAVINPVLVQSGAPAGSELACPAGQTYLKWDLGDQTVNQTIDPIIYTVEILETVRNGNYINTTVVSTPGDPSQVSARRDTSQIQIVTPTGVKVSKQVDKPIIEVNPAGVATPRTLTWTVEFANIDSSDNVSDVDVIDVLPANSVNGSSFSGSLRLDSATVIGGNQVSIGYTKRAADDLKVDPDDASNESSGATVWCSAASGGTVTSGNGSAADCPSSAAEVTGLRFQRAGAFNPTDLLKVAIAMTPIGNAGGDIYENRTAGRAAGVTQPVGPAIRTARVVESSVGNLVWEDLNADGVQDPGEPGVAGFGVKLTGKDLDNNPVSLTTVTGADGTYAFTGLASGTYHVNFDPNSLSSNSTFTTADTGTDDLVNSDGDVTTGEAASFTLAPDSADPSWDQGLIIDRNVAITVDKRLVSQTDLSADHAATVTYELTVANAGTAEGTYTLADEVKFGGNITVNTVTATNTAPGGIIVDPAFDGLTDTTLATNQVLAGGASHVYQVVVAATLATTITTEQRDCTLSSTETGTGYLNEAQLTVDNVTQTDTACGVPDKPVVVDVGSITETRDPIEPRGSVSPNQSLASAGGPAWWLIAIALGALIFGAAFVGTSGHGRRRARRR